MKALRIRWEKQGGHVHCRVFTAQSIEHTFANCGELCFDIDEWSEVSVAFECGGFEVIGEDE